MVTGRTTRHCLRRPDSQVVTNEARQDLHNKKQARDTCIYLVLKTRNTKQGEWKHATCVTSRHDPSPFFNPLSHLQVVKTFYFPSPPDNQKVRSTTCNFPWPVVAVLFSLNPRPDDVITLFVTETSFQFKEWYSESLQQRLCTQNKTKRIEKIIFPYGNKIYNTVLP